MNDEELRGWIAQMGWGAEPEDEVTLRLLTPGSDLPPLFVRRTDHWLLLAMLPVLDPSHPPVEDLPHRLLAINRDMRLAKFALSRDEEVVLCAELPTESLDFGEFCEAADRIVRYYRHYREHLSGG